MSSATPVTGGDGNKYGEQLTFDPEFRGPVKRRSCTDIICLFLFVAFLAGWVVVAIFAFREGDPSVLLYPTDSLGNICGTGAFSDKPYLLFFDLRKCISPKVVYTGCPTPEVCVSECPKENYFPDPSDPNPSLVKDKLVCEYDVDKKRKSLPELLDEGHCATLYLKSTPLLGRCIPDIFFNNTIIQTYVQDSAGKIITDEGNKITNEEIKNATSNIAHFLKVTEISAKIFADFKVAWKQMLVGFVGAMLISLIWIVLMRWIAGPMIWLSIILILAFNVYGCYYSTDKYIKLKGVEGSEKEFHLTWDIKSYLEMRKTWLAFAIITGIVFGILFLVLLFLRKRIKIAIALIVQASRAVGTMTSTLFFPIFPYVLQFIFLAVWIAVALYIASSGKASFVFADVPAGLNFTNGTTCNPKRYNSTGEGLKCMFQTYGLKNNLYSAHIYNLFGLFWGVFFSIGLGQLALAGAFSSYYWTREKDRDIPCCAIGASLYRTFRFHLGSVAFGSLLIALVKLIRVMLEYIDAKCKKYDNWFTKCIMICCKCCFFCLEKFLRFISKNAYIMIAVYGKNFCTSARKAFMLLMRNIVRVVVLDKITDFLLFLGKLVVVAATGVLSFYYFTVFEVAHGHDTLNYNIAPPIIITIGSYIIASAFFSVYGMAVDTLFLCFLEDCERNDGSLEKPYFMSKDLMKLLHKKNKFRDHPAK